MKEVDFQKQIIDLAHVCGWYVAHFRPAKTEKGWRTPVQADGKGFPDLVMVRPPRRIYAEVKSDKGKLSDDQAMWLELLRLCGEEVYAWWPKDIDTIMDVLR